MKTLVLAPSPLRTFSPFSRFLYSNLNNNATHNYLLSPSPSKSFSSLTSTSPLLAMASQNVSSGDEVDIFQLIQAHQEKAARLSPIEDVRTLLHYSLRGVLSTFSQKYEGYPSASMVDFACDTYGSPILAVSNLAVHTKDLLATSRCSLLVARDPEDRTDLVITVHGDAVPVPETEKEGIRATYLARHPTAFWVDFGDFHFIPLINSSFFSFIIYCGTHRSYSQAENKFIWLKMGKKGSGNWFSTVKKVFIKPSCKDYLPTDHKKEKLENQWQHEAREVVSVEKIRAESCSDLTINRESNENSSISLAEDRNHDIHVIEATVADAEAATYTAPKTIKLDGYNHKSKEEIAATLIQSYYRGYLARRALRALRGLVKLQALVRGHSVRKQAQMKMRCMQSLVRVQSKVRARRLQLRQSKVVEEVKLRSSIREESLLLNKQETHSIENTRRKQQVYNAYQQQQKWLHSDLDDEECFENEHENPQQSWNWLDKWMASQHVVRQEDSSYVSLSITDDISEKTFELGPEDVNLAHQNEKSPYSSTQSNKDSVPSYMAPTKSAKAKIRSPGPIKPKSPPGVAQWNSTPKKVIARRWSYDSSARSPNPKISAKWMATYSPQTRVHDRTSLMGPPARRYNHN